MNSRLNSPAARSSVEERRRAVLAEAPGLEIAEQLFAALPDVLFCVKDRSHRYVSANAAFVAATLKNSISQVIGRRATDIFPPIRFHNAVLSTCHNFAVGGRSSNPSLTGHAQR